MFSLPQGDSNDGEVTIKDNLQVLQLAQDSRTLRQLLQICYPGLPKISTELKEIGSLAEAAYFYQMDDLPAQLQRIISNTSHLKTDPIRVYIIACLWGWKELAEEAARASLQTELFPLKMCPEMENVSASALIRLFHYRDRCGLVAKTTANKIPSHLKEEWPLFTSDNDLCNCPDNLRHKQKGNWSHLGYVGHRKDWWTDYLLDVGNKLEKRPCKKTILSCKISPHVTSSVSCRTCVIKIGDYMPIFNQKLWSAVAEAIGKVRESPDSTVVKCSPQQCRLNWNS
jgi:hypothetical protein